MCYESGVVFTWKRSAIIALVVLSIVGAFGYLFYDLNQTILAFGDMSELIDETPMIGSDGEESYYQSDTLL